MREKLFHRDFTLVVIGQIISLLGNAVLRFVLPLYLLDVTGSRSLFGLCSAAAFVPMVVLTPLGGVVADRLHKQRIMVVLDFFTCALVALTALALGHLPLVPVLVAAMMLLYGISGAYQPAVQASMPLLCPPDRLVDGNAVINQVSALSSLLGPLLGSLVYGAFGVTPVLAGASACFFASAVMELFIQIPHTPRHTGASVWQTARADLAESGTFLRQERPEILKYIALVSAFNLLLSALLVVSMPVLIKQTLVLGDTWYGLNQTAMAAGSLAGGLTAGLLGPRLTVRRSWLTLLACGVCLIPMGLCLLAGVAICRKTPDTEPQILLAVPVLLLARLIFAYRLYSVDPVLTNYYLELLGLMLLILASYRLSGFAVQAGGPRMFGFYADLTAILAVTLLADGHSAALLPLGGAAALEGFQRAMRMSDIAEKKTEE